MALSSRRWCAHVRKTIPSCPSCMVGRSPITTTTSWPVVGPEFLPENRRRSHRRRRRRPQLVQLVLLLHHPGPQVVLRRLRLHRHHLQLLRHHLLLPLSQLLLEADYLPPMKAISVLFSRLLREPRILSRMAKPGSWHTLLLSGTFSKCLRNAVLPPRPNENSSLCTSSTMCSITATRRTPIPLCSKRCVLVLFLCWRLHSQISLLIPRIVSTR
mmetsp:Transcript_38279/g.96305  ORF Transcript_38279/g.96305 Transcript_38279/m.96305 type:complete len:214 (+) Transcript_38279:209-850(+)